MSSSLEEMKESSKPYGELARDKTCASSELPKRSWCRVKNEIIVPDFCEGCDLYKPIWEIRGHSER